MDAKKILWALQIGRDYVSAVVKEEGGIDKCDIGTRSDLEAIDAAIAELKSA